MTPSGERPGRVKARVHADENILANRHISENSAVLKRPGDAPFGDRVGTRPGNRFATKDNLAVIGSEQAAKEVKDGRLSGTIWSDEANGLTLVDRERQSVDGTNPPERFNQLPNLQKLATAARPYLITHDPLLITSLGSPVPKQPLRAKANQQEHQNAVGQNSDVVKRTK